MVRSATMLVSLVLAAGCRGQACDCGPAETGDALARSDVSKARQTVLAYEPCARTTPGVDRMIQPIRVGGVSLIPREAVLRPGETGRRPRPATIVLGAAGDSREALPRTLDRLDRLARKLTRIDASALVVLGGIDPTFEGILDVLSRLGRHLPVLALPGDRESKSGFQAAVENAGPRVVDLTRVRAVLLPGATLVGVPGYHLPHHLFAGPQGCSYDRADIEEIIALARRLPSPKVLLAHGPPRGEGPRAVDRAFGQVNIGDLLLTRLIKEGGFAFGLFAHVHESAGNAVTLAGTPVPEHTWSDSLLLNVGAADSVPHEQLDGAVSNGTAAVMEIEGSRARYRMVRLSAL